MPHIQTPTLWWFNNSFYSSLWNLRISAPRFFSATRLKNLANYSESVHIGPVGCLMSVKWNCDIYKQSQAYDIVKSTFDNTRCQPELRFIYVSNCCFHQLSLRHYAWCVCVCGVTWATGQKDCEKENSPCLQTDTMVSICKYGKWRNDKPFSHSHTWYWSVSVSLDDLYVYMYKYVYIYIGVCLLHASNTYDLW